jgi:hypothetical protein
MKSLPLLILLAFPGYARTDSLQNEKTLKQYDKRITFDISLEPNVFFDVGGKSINSFYYISGAYYAANMKTTYNKIHKQQFGGFDLSIGVAVKKKFHFNILSGIDGNSNMAWVPVGTDIKMNLLNSKVSPFIHFGGGYLVNIPGVLNDETSDLIIGGNGALALAGVGVCVKFAPAFSIQISSDYRFLFENYKYVYRGFLFDSGLVGPHPPNSNQLFCHQLGLRLALIFY